MPFDGNISWSGGMDSSRFPSLIGQNQYFRGCNVQLKRSGGGLATRDGIHHVRINFNNHKFLEKLYSTGHIQAEGWFNDGYSEHLACAVNGYVILFEEINEGHWGARLINDCDQNNPNLTKGWFSKTPFGTVYNDGESLPMWVTSTEWRRTDPSKDEIGVGRMGVYVQNRLFYVSEDGKEIFFSDFRNPLSRSESINANLLSFVVPEDDDEITAIGKQKVMINSAEGGVLIFSTLDNIYSIDVRGPIESWEIQNVGVGKVQESVRGIGASSGYSFESFNTNIYFRSREYGICDLRQSESQFVQDDDFTSQSIEADYWLGNDTEWMLDQCYSRTYKGRLYTTIAPEFREDGYVFWNGMLSYHPDPKYSNQQRENRRFEGIITGVRPWCITSVKSNNRKQRLFIHSYDEDGVNRIYQFVDSDHDVNHNCNRVEIESWVESRGFSFGNDMIPKINSEKFYKLRSIPRDLKVKIYSRTESTGSWNIYYDHEHLVGGLKRSENGGIVPASFKDQDRDYVSLPSDQDNRGGAYGSVSGKEFFSIQDRFHFKGSCILDKFVREAEHQGSKHNVIREVNKYQSIYSQIKDFSYSIATSKETNW